MAKRDEQLDLLRELTSHPGWRVLTDHAAHRRRQLFDSLKPDAETEFDLIRKEVVIGRMKELDEFFQEIEVLLRQYTRKVAEGG